MKKFGIFLLAFLLSFALIPAKRAHALSEAQGIRIALTAANIGPLTWVPIVSSTQKTLQGLTVMNGGNLPLELGLALTGASANTEVSQLILPQVEEGKNPGLYYPMNAPYGARLSLRAIGSTATYGDVQVNLIFN